MANQSQTFEELVEVTMSVETPERSEMGDASGLGGGSGSPASKKAKRNLRLVFKEEWTQDPELCGWVARDPKDPENGTICTVCNCKLRVGHKAALLFHKNCAKHIRNFAAQSGQGVSLKLEPNPSGQRAEGHNLSAQEGEAQAESSARNTSKEEWVTRAEQLLSGFLLEHRIPLSDAEHLVEMMKRVFGDSQIARDMSMEKVQENFNLMQGNRSSVEENE